MQIDAKRLYTTDDLMEILHCGRRTIYRYIEEKKLPVIRLSRQRIFVMGSELTEWLRKQR
jgi:excisionase family DNA binding protein